ncbi:MAG TPA: fibronectin type III domain-containing protein, partial [Myxococcota bacterium]|nr:fibronectin type III domain-containing protein [Myxococcota bacterium]
MNRYSSFLWLTGAAALVAVVATSTDAEGAGVPATPSPALQSSTYNSVTLAWPVVAGAQRYNIQLCKAPICRGEIPQWFAVDPATSTSGDRVVYTLKDLSAATKYYIYVQAAVLTPEASKSIWSIAVEVTTPAAPPVTLRATLEDNDGSTCFYYTVPGSTTSISLLTYPDATAAKFTSGYGLA